MVGFFRKVSVLMIITGILVLVIGLIQYKRASQNNISNTNIYNNPSTPYPTSTPQKTKKK
jgi:hypothetical protein